MRQAQHLQLQRLFAHLPGLEILVQPDAHGVYRLHILVSELVAYEVSVSVLGHQALANLLYIVPVGSN